jgi:hypothetical protein
MYFGEEMAVSTFDSYWHTILTSLAPGTSIWNWTALKGNLGDEMMVVEVSPESVVIKTPKAKDLQNIPKKDFQKVWELWSSYKLGQVQRQQIREITFYSKYIISILHWVEEK